MINNHEIIEKIKKEISLYSHIKIELNIFIQL